MKYALPVVALLALTQGCSLLSALPIAGLGGGEPGVFGEEQSMLYARGLREVMPDPLKDLKISPTERVWVINKNGGTNSDRPIDALTYDAIVDVLREGGISEVVARDDDMLRSMYVEYTESSKLAARADSLARDGRIQPADVMVSYRVMRINQKNPGFIILGIRFVVGGHMHKQTLPRIQEHFNKWLLRVGANTNAGVLHDDGLEALPNFKERLEGNFFTAHEHIHAAIGVATSNFHDGRDLLGQQTKRLAHKTQHAIVAGDNMK